MATSKFRQLCAAYGKAQIQFEAYKKDCHQYAIEIIEELKGYYKVPESQFSLYRIVDNHGFELVTPAAIHAIELKEDNYWHFGVGLTVCQAPETLPEELILIHLMFRKNSKGQYFLKYAFEEDEFEIKRDDPATYKPFFDFLFNIIIKSYQESLQRFVGVKTERKLGYIQ